VDAKQFDQIVHRLAQASTRRIALAGLLGALAGTLSLTGAEPASAKRRKRKRKKKSDPNSKTPPPPPAPPVSPPPPFVCQGNTKACGTVCIPASDCCGGCSQGLTCCKGTCKNLATDGQNCGACGLTCVTNVCDQGVCDCQGAQVNCPAACACAARLNNAGTVCNFGSGITDCDNDAVCGPGRVCLVNNKCSGPCVP